MALDIRALVAAGVELAWSLTESVRRSGTYKTAQTVQYDPTAGAPLTTDQQFNVSFIVAPYEERETDLQDVQAGDERVVIRIADLPQGFTPQKDDVLIENNGTVRNIVAFTIDPTNQVLTLQTRRKGF